MDLATEPRVLLLDEPLAGMSTEANDAPGAIRSNRDVQLACLGEH